VANVSDSMSRIAPPGHGYARCTVPGRSPDRPSP
jgi:hypothetical protein